MLWRRGSSSIVLRKGSHSGSLCQALQKLVRLTTVVRSRIGTYKSHERARQEIR